jgi:thiol-disulfide isomerase/thioredoxin
MTKLTATHVSWIVGGAFLLALIAVPSPAVVASQPATAMTSRVVLAEDFAATWCLFCPGVTGALERLEATVGKDKLVVLAHHISGSRFNALDFSDGDR